MAALTYKEINCITRLYEYMYRKGAYDASVIGDEDVISKFAERDETYMDLRFLNEYSGMKVEWRQYSDFMQMACGKINAHSLRNFLAYSKNNLSTKKYLCIGANFYYTLGASEWSGDTAIMTKEHLENIGNGFRIIRDGKTKKSADFLDEIKYRINEIGYIHDKEKTRLKPGGLARMISDAILKRKIQMSPRND